MKKNFFVVILTFLSISASANTYYAIKSGSWSNGTFSTSLGGSSCGCIPTVMDNVIIPSPYNVMVTSDFIIGTGGAVGILNVELGGTLDLDKKNLVVNAGGVLNLYGSLKT